MYLLYKKYGTKFLDLIMRLKIISLSNFAIPANKFIYMRLHKILYILVTYRLHECTWCKGYTLRTSGQPADGECLIRCSLFGISLRLMMSPLPHLAALYQYHQIHQWSIGPLSEQPICVRETKLLWTVKWDFSTHSKPTNLNTFLNVLWARSRDHNLCQNRLIWKLIALEKAFPKMWVCDEAKCIKIGKSAKVIIMCEWKWMKI